MKLAAALTLVGLALTVTPGMAAPILGGSAGGWRAGQPAQENLSTFWDGNSWDSTSLPDGSESPNPCSAGALIGGANCGLNPAATTTAANAGLAVSSYSLGTAGAFEVWSNGDGSADHDYVYGEDTGAWYDFTILAEFTDDWAINEFGFYDASNPQNRTAIFEDAQTSGAGTSVYIPNNFGFYYRNTSGNGEMFFTQTSLNGASGTNQQFASFQIGDQNFVGIEDIFANVVTPSWQWNSTDYDYNDLMIGFRRTGVPEPSSLLLVGMGLAGLMARARRKARA